MILPIIAMRGNGRVLNQSRPRDRSSRVPARALTERSNSMAAQFAGSRSLDERRRRRLATESEEAVPETAAAPMPRRVAAPKTQAATRGPSHFPLRKLISARLWKHAGVALLGLLIGSGILAGGWAAEIYPARLGPGLVRFFDLSAARLVRCYVSLAILLASQLAWLIWWLRSQSLRDFKGHYRGWACFAFLAFLAAFAIQTDAFRAWSVTVDWLWHVEIHNKQTLSWMVPAMLCGLPAWRFLHREMRDCPLSLILLSLAVSLGAVLAALVVCGPLPLPIVLARLVQCGIAMLAAQCLFLSLLFQARHAIYISVEPPAERPVWFVALWRRYRKGREGSRRSRKSATPSTEIAATAPRAQRRKRSTASAPPPESPAKRPNGRSGESPASPVPASKPSARVDQRQMRRSA